VKVFLTGGTGFIGSTLIRQLQARGDEVVALVRTLKGAKTLMDDDVRPVAGDILQPASYRRAMEGADVVFHLAAWYQVGVHEFERMHRINVDGVRVVLNTAIELGVPKTVYTSTVAVFGHTGGRLVDESYIPPGRDFLSEYERTKYLAHYEVAAPLQRQGAPIIIVQPGGVYGPGDSSQVGSTFKRYVRGKLPVMVGPNSALTWAHVEDIAAGHLLAAEKGRTGESYILAGPTAAFREVFRICEQVSGIPAPRLWIPDSVAIAGSRFLKSVNRLLPQKIRGLYELVRNTGDLSYLARADKARQELGWMPRSLEQGLAETLEWFRNLKDEPPPMLFSANENDGRVFGP